MAMAIARISDVPVPAREVISPQHCPANLLPWLAWAMGVDTWDAGWSEKVKRDVIASAYVVRRYKGTVGAVKRAALAVGTGIELSEWFQLDPPGEVHTFELSKIVSGGGATEEFADSVIYAVSAAKPVRSHFTFKQSVFFDGGLCAVSELRPAVYRRLRLVDKD